MNNRNIPSIDISNSPELLRIVEEVKTSKKPRILKKDSENVALIMPVGTAKTAKKREKTKSDYEAFKSAAGGWKGIVDTEKLKQDIYKSRKISTRPPLEL